MNEYQGVDHVALVTDILQPRILGLTDIITETKGQIDEMKVCIQSFDSSLSLKLNKTGLAVFEEKLKDVYLPYS